MDTLTKINKLPKIKYFLLFFIFLGIFSNLAENSKELEKKLIQAPEVEKSIILNKLSKAYWFDKEKEKTLRYGKVALKYAKKLKQKQVIPIQEEQLDQLSLPNNFEQVIFDKNVDNVIEFSKDENEITKVDFITKSSLNLWISKEYSVNLSNEEFYNQ